MASSKHDAWLRRRFVHTETTDTHLRPLSVVLMQERPGMTGVYEQTESGLRPARTVSDDTPHRASILLAWTGRLCDCTIQSKNHTLE